MQNLGMPLNSLQTNNPKRCPKNTCRAKNCESM